MNTKSLKAATLAACVIAGMGATPPAMASLTGPQSLSVALNSVDVWVFTCPALFPRGRATVQDEIVPFDLNNRLQVVLGQVGQPSNQVTDNNPVTIVLPGPVFAIRNGEGGPVSGIAAVNGLAGIPYAAAFKKTAAGVENYTGDLYCTNIFGLRVNPGITRQINQ